MLSLLRANTTLLLLIKDFLVQLRWLKSYKDYAYFLTWILRWSTVKDSSVCPHSTFVVRRLLGDIFAVRILHRVTRTLQVLQQDTTRPTLPRTSSWLHSYVFLSLHLLMESMSVITKLVNLIPGSGELIQIYLISLLVTCSEVYSMQLYVVTFVCDLRQVGGFHFWIRFSPPIKLPAPK